MGQINIHRFRTMEKACEIIKNQETNRQNRVEQWGGWLFLRSIDFPIPRERRLTSYSVVCIWYLCLLRHLAVRRCIGLRCLCPGEHTVRLTNLAHFKP